MVVVRSVTLRDVAGLVGVDSSTVSRAFGEPERVSARTRDRVLAVAAELGYRPNPLARAVARRSSTIVPLIVPDISNPFFAEVARGAELAARERGLRLVLCDARGDADLEAHYLESMKDLLAPFALLCPRWQNDSRLISQRADGLVVLLAPVTDPGDLPSVTVDNRGGVTAAMEHLFKLGHRDVACLVGPLSALVSRQRLDAARDAMVDSGLSPRVLQGGFGMGSGSRAGAVFVDLEPRPTALVAANDLSALGFIGEVQRRGLSVPEDVSVVGFDGLEMGARLFPSLSSVVQPMEEIGRRAVDLALNILADGDPDRQVKLPVEFVARGTTAVPKEE